jgi:hypothetical protein
VSVLVNIWHRHRPLGVFRLPAGFAAGLSNSPDGLSNSPDGLSNSPDGLSNSPDGLSNSPDALAPLNGASHDETIVTWAPVLAVSAGRTEGDGHGDGASEADWMSCRVGYLPLTPAIGAVPGWRELATKHGLDIGFPFRHLPVRVRHLQHSTGIQRSSHIPFRYMREVELECDLWSDGESSQRKDWWAIAVFLAELG